MKRAILCDVDGTLALFEGIRDGLDFTKVGTDKVRQTVRNFLNLYAIPVGYQIIIVTGRPESCRGDTEKWLEKNYIRYNELFMRRNDDFRHDSIIKSELYLEKIEPFYSVELVLDDRDKVVRMWRALGLECWQVAQAAY